LKPNSILFEIAWEVCNQIGGIFTYLKSKVPTMLDTYGENYFLIGPYFPEKARLDFREVNEPADSVLGSTISHMRELGFEIHYGYWLLEDSRPRVLLINPSIGYERLNDVKTRLWQKHQISTFLQNDNVDQVLGFGEVVRLLMSQFTAHLDINQDVLLHFNEWMSASCLPDLVTDEIRVATVFTSHATVLGRYLAPNETDYFANIEQFQWLPKARHYGIESAAAIERVAAQKAHVLVTNSELTAKECEVFLGRKPDTIVGNGINKRPDAGHEAFNQHQENRGKIDLFVKSFFLPSFPVKTEKTLYFFTSGRYEYKNKGFNVTLEAAARLNERLMREDSDYNIVLFLISKNPFHSIRPDVLEARKRFKDLNKICKEISARLGPRIYSNVTGTAQHKLPDLNTLVDEELLLTWKQALANFKREGLPPVSTHSLEKDDEVTQFCERAGLDNGVDKRVKIIYHPDFIERTKSLFGLDYQEFVRGCNLGIFPSLYEPWGNAAMESVLQGTPTISSDTSGFGKFLQQKMPQHEEVDLKVIRRRYQTEEDAIRQLTETLYNFTETFKKEKFVPRTSLPKHIMDSLCWTELQQRYAENYRLAMLRYQPTANLY